MVADNAARSATEWARTPRLLALMRREAHHEAAHAVIAHALGMHVALVRLNWDPDGEQPIFGSYESFTRVELVLRQWMDDSSGRLALALYAIAGRAFDALAGDKASQWWRGTSGSDLAGFREAVEAIDRTERQVWRMARLMVRWHRHDIEAVARALMSAPGGDLTGDEVRELLGAVR